MSHPVTRTVLCLNIVKGDYDGNDSLVNVSLFLVNDNNVTCFLLPAVKKTLRWQDRVQLGEEDW